MGDKNAKSHKRKIIYVKQNFRFAVIEKKKLVFQKQIGQKISADEYPYAISGDNQSYDESDHTAAFGIAFDPCRFVEHSQNHIPMNS